MAETECTGCGSRIDEDDLCPFCNECELCCECRGLGDPDMDDPDTPDYSFDDDEDEDDE